MIFSFSIPRLQLLIYSQKRIFLGVAVINRNYNTTSTQSTYSYNNLLQTLSCLDVYAYIVVVTPYLPFYLRHLRVWLCEFIFSSGRNKHLFLSFVRQFKEEMAQIPIVFSEILNVSCKAEFSRLPITDSFFFPSPSTLVGESTILYAS